MKALAAASCLLGALLGTAAIGAEEEHHSHPVPEKLGKVTFQTSCKPAVSPQFERAVALLHSFAYTAAAQAFGEVAMADPACAMAHWGAAMSYYHPLWSPPTDDELSKGMAEAAAAARLPTAMPREQQLIAAINAYYRDAKNTPPPARAKAYAAAMSTAASANPTDVEMQIFYALALLATAPPQDRTHAIQKQAAAILEPYYRDHHDHPGVVHYLIHAYDSAELAPRGLPAARLYATIAPSAPHALHMPSHIFTRLGLWDDSIASNQAARVAARHEGDIDEELHAMDYLVYAYLQRRKPEDAERVVADLASMGDLAGGDFKVGYSATAMPVRLVVEERKWDRAAALQPLAGSPPHVAAVVYWAKALASARTGHPDAAAEQIAQLESCVQKLRDANNDYWLAQTQTLSAEAKAWQAAASNRPDDAIALLRTAADAEDALEKLPVTPGPIIPAREQLGDLLLMQKRNDEALQAFRAALTLAPGRNGAITGAVQAAERSGQPEVAKQMRALMAD